MSIQSLRIYQDFCRLEDSYRAQLSVKNADPQRIIILYNQIERTFQRVNRHAGFIRRFLPTDTPDINMFFEDYLHTFQRMHKINCGWCSLYLDLCWPADQQSPKNKRKKELRQQIRAEAENHWKMLEEKRDTQDLSHQERSVVGLKRQLERAEPNSPEWRRIYRTLTTAVYQTMSAVLLEHKHALYRLFRKQMGGGSERLLDFLHGYTSYLPKEEVAQIEKSDVHFIPVLKSIERKRRMFVGLKMLTWGLAVIIFLTGLNMTDLDNRMVESAHLWVQKLLKRDPASLALEAKKSYFRNRVLDLAGFVDEDRIRENLDHFLRHKLYQKDEGALYLAENILQEFFLGISERKLSPELQRDVVYAAALVDERIAQSIDLIAAAYSRVLVRESVLKRQILDIRHYFMDHYVFPFIFLTIYDEVAYIFLVAEEVHHQYFYPIDEMKKINLDPDQYGQIVDLPIKALVVKGEKYPFKDRAGYFDGEFSIVFSSLTQKVEWTAEHEIAHHIDYMREKIEKIEPHKSVELNAMLFPIIYSDDRKDYIEQRIVSKLHNPKIQDYYAQAAKGILNGFLIYFEGGARNLKDKLITDRFERKRIDYIKGLINSQTSKRIGKVAKELYLDPEKYLHTAGGGAYISLMTDTGEVILGAHKITQRGFILQNSWGGSLARKGPRFIMDASGDEGLDPVFDIITFLKRIIRLAVFGEKEFRSYTNAENIAAAVVFFFFFEACCIFAHILGTKIRRRKYLGKLPAEIIDEIYTQNPWSDGKSYGQELNERLLLKRVIAAKGNIDDQLCQEINSFKAVVDSKRRMLFDLCLCLAVYSPKKSYIYNKFHDIIFYLPFIGPYIARSRWLYKGQKQFNDREDYNLFVESLLKELPMNILPKEGLEQYRSGVSAYIIDQSAKAVESEEANLEKLDTLVQAELIKAERRVRLNENWITDSHNTINEHGTEFDQLDRYRPGDDIRRIDWNVTARSSKQQAYIRKYVNQHKVKVAFLMDMRYLDEEEVRAKWAADFLRSLNILDDEKILEHLIFVNKDGTVTIHRVHITPGLMNFRSASRIWERIKGLWTQTQYRSSHLHIGGLYFYTREENEKFARQLALTDFQGTAQPMRVPDISLKKMNVFLIGDTPRTRAEFKRLAGDDSNRFTFWEEPAHQG